MLIPLSFKTPDVVYNAVENADIKIKRTDDMDDADYEYAVDDVKKHLKDEIEHHIKYGEYLTVYYNTETDKLQLERE